MHASVGARETFLKVLDRGKIETEIELRLAERMLDCTDQLPGEYALDDGEERVAITYGEAAQILLDEFVEENGPGPAPLHPDVFYRDSGWKGWDDFLGITRGGSAGVEDDAGEL
jgi:hypothetical protein